MSTMRVQLRRIAIALGVSTAIVVLIATLLPRSFLVNDDPGLVLHLRLGTLTPWMSPVLARGLASAYQAAPDVPWYGLYQYALVVISGAVLLHTSFELVDRRPGFGAVATLLGACMLVASHTIVAIGITWTTVSMSTLGTALVAFVAHLQTCEATGTRASPVRALIYGLLFVAGFALRQAVIAAVGAALLPLLGWFFVKFVRSRHLPRPASVIAFVAPFAIVVAVQGRVPPLVEQPRGADYEEFNALRGQISEAAAFSNLDTRAPELLERAGWTVEEYRDFSNWLLADDSEFTTDKVRRLVETGGIPRSMGLDDVFGVLHGIATDSAASVWLFLSLVAGALLLAWLGVVDRSRVVWFSVGNLVFLAIVPVVMSAVSRFPQRVSLSFYTVAAFGMLVFLAGEVLARPPRAESDNPQRPVVALLVMSLLMFVWARNVLAWTHREPSPYHATLRAFADRVTARNGIVMVAPGIAEMDPLLADPRGYDALPSGWGTFTAPWFNYIERFGIRSGSELLHKMVDHPNAYLVTGPHAQPMYEDWIRRRVGNPSVRLALVDTAVGMNSWLRSELYRVVTTPLVRGSDEWNLLAKNQRAMFDELAGPPEVIGPFRTIALTAPYEKHLSSFRRAAAGIVVEPIDGGSRITVSATGGCTDKDVSEAPDYAGIHIPVNGLRAVRFHITLLDSENILGIYVYGQTDGVRAARWSWDFDPLAQQFGFTGDLSFVPGYSTHRFWLLNDTAGPREIRNLHVFIAVKPGTRAGFELRKFQISEP